VPGAIAAGHELTAEAAIHIFEAGGNAFDAALAALCAACVVEPVLASLGGGGFLLSRDNRGKTVLYDFFVQTPSRQKTGLALDFNPILADFGNVQQEFHVGMASIAVPGTIRGLFDIHRERAGLPMHIIMEPAIRYAREGFRINALQAYLFNVVAPIYRYSPSVRAIHANTTSPSQLPAEGQLFRQPQLADTLEQLCRESDALFYQGELGQQLVNQCRHQGGQLEQADLNPYQTIRRRPLCHHYSGYELHTNPPPSSGGLLIAYALEQLAACPLEPKTFGSTAHLKLLAETMALTDAARYRKPHDTEVFKRYELQPDKAWHTSKGTTHISVVDTQGNAASMSLSNGEGCGHMLANSGIMPNNMLGEEDLHSHGFHRWPCNTRVSSMMAPSLLFGPDRLVALGSGGSNRLRGAILQTLYNLIDFGMPLQEAVTSPRIHLEDGHINIEPGFTAQAVESLIHQYPQHHVWTEPNLFFGGCHGIDYDGQQLCGQGDPRRGGVFRSTTQ
jgi:gamma-glutamyltranspeptidase/glutathione hydrolase